jgi:serralysin
MVLKIIDKKSNGNGDLFNSIDGYGMGNDTVIVQMPGGATNTIKTYGGDDTVVVTGDTTDNWVVNVFYLGTGNDTLLGGNGSEDYFDQDGNDQVQMGAGNDFVRAGLGDDTIDGGSGTDLVSFNTLMNAYGDTMFVSDGITFDLAETGIQQLGIFGADRFTNFEDVAGTNGADTLLGTNTANSIWGLKGDDVLNGRGGNDHIAGGQGADVIIGGAGADELWGGNDVGILEDSAADIFTFLQVSDSDLTHIDTIWGFETHADGGADKIDLSALDASSVLRGNNAFVFVGSGPFNSLQGEISVYQLDGDTIVSIDTDGDVAAEMAIVLKGVTNLTVDDFVL